jgi:hypothetical protein
MTYHEFRFRIDAWTPETIPMARLAEYMTQLAAMFGERERVHFDRLEAGSAVLVQRTEAVAYNKVTARLEAIRQERAPKDALAAFNRIDSMLADDNAVGQLTDEMTAASAVILQFPGRERPKALRYGPVLQNGTIEGVLVKIGGIDQTVPVHIQREYRERGEEKDIAICNTSREMASKIAPHLFGSVLRLTGEGKWFREQDGTWTLDRFNIHAIEVLDDTSIASLVEKMKTVEGNRWKEIEEPLAELAKIRHGDGIH